MVDLIGIQLTLLIGPTLPVPAPVVLSESIQSVEVARPNCGPAGFQITFNAGRSGLADIVDYPLLVLPLLSAYSRVILIVRIGVTAEILIDGFITHVEVAPSEQPGASTITVTGEDVTLMMDLADTATTHLAQGEYVLAQTLLASYLRYLGFPPTVIPPPSVDPANPVEYVPTQHGTDRSHLLEMAARSGYVFNVTPGPVPLQNSAYWGPERRFPPVQSALRANMGPQTNVDEIQFTHAALGALPIRDAVQDSLTGVTLPVVTVLSTRPPLALINSLAINQLQGRQGRLDDSGLNAVQAYARAQGATDRSADTVTATGTLDAARYGGLLRPDGLVGVGGVGANYDGFYYVEKVTHTIGRGSYKQSFTLRRDGVGSTTPVLVP